MLLPTTAVSTHSRTGTGVLRHRLHDHETDVLCGLLSSGCNWSPSKALFDSPRTTLESVMIYIANIAAVSAYILSKQGHDNKTYMLARSIFDLNGRTLGCLFEDLTASRSSMR